MDGTCAFFDSRVSDLNHFACYVGGRCRNSTTKDIVEELHLHWHTLKELEKQ
jgi:hypothetical protein